ncbi:hypothetical protein IWW38_004213 [Coemansia aciculifera]|uniref:Uncharacterized protein n=1 Tax=Coemansia aciculifera TaxID=417176 RepID=A0ACC1LZ63_9FUNG|nr:hypothetical protein IWW38_004213 [Coemansia aciculifera]
MRHLYKSSDSEDGGDYHPNVAGLDRVRHCQDVAEPEPLHVVSSQAMMPVFVATGHESNQIMPWNRTASAVATVAATMSQYGDGQSPGLDSDQMRALMFSLRDELANLQQCVLRMREMKQELVRIVSTFTHYTLHDSTEQHHHYHHQQRLLEPPPPSLQVGGGSLGSVPRKAPSHLVIPLPPPQISTGQLSAPPSSVSSALSRIAISSLVDPADIAPIYAIRGASSQMAGKKPAPL